MTKPDYDAAKAYALHRLADELPPTAHYHSLQHTRDDVLPAAARLAAGEGVNNADRLCLLTAACFHDLGHIVQSQDHEELSAQIAVDVLPEFGYSPDQIALICRLIRATKIPQTPETLLEAIIVDADMDSLGRDDFLATSHALRDELAAGGQTIVLREWYERQIAFLQAHRYFTATARTLRDPGKKRNIHRLHDLIAALSSEKP